MKRLNSFIGDKLAFWLSTMACFYLICALVIIPLFFQRPTDLVGWVQYVVQSIFQGIALPVLGYVARIAGERSDKLALDTHDAVMSELAEIKESHQEQREFQQAFMQSIERHVKGGVQ